jgi:hypothetical protein
MAMAKTEEQSLDNFFPNRDKKEWSSWAALVGAEEWQVADGAWEPGWVTVGLQAPGPAE